VDLTVAAIAFGTIFLVELPDKTFIAALVLSTRFRPLAVWVGVGLAFAVQTGVAVTAGALATLLPDAVIRTVALLIFLAGAVVLVRTAPGADASEKEQEEEYAAKAGAEGTKSFVKAAAASFLILFAAEWGDLSQLLTISLVAKYESPVSVFIGALGALLAVSGLAVVSGRALLKRISLHALHYLGAAVCLTLAALTAYELIA
jgi:Ca2+/H+ antiporter, TMEM165/GDT1 family